MFDTLTLPSSRPSARALVLTGSALAHAVALGALAVASLLDVPRLAVDEPRTTVAVLSLPGDPGGGGAPARALVAKPAPKPRRPPPDTVQPARTPPPAPAADAAAVAATAPAEGPPTDGPPGNGAGGDGTGFGAPTGAGCNDPAGCGDGPPAADPCVADPASCRPPTPPPDPCAADPAACAPVVISPTVAAGLRRSGEARIPAPPVVRARMARSGEARVLGTVKLCMDRRGTVTSATVLRSTGHPEYDDALQAGMRAWRYAPFSVDGRAVPACTVVTVVYEQR